MKILTMIPARMGSNRIKKKNLRILGDIPLIEHIIRSAKKSKYTSEIFINSESTEFQKIAQKCGVKFYKRPEKFASDEATNDDFTMDFLEKYDCDILLQLLPTSPFITSKDIDQFMSKMIDHKYETMISVNHIQIEAIYNGQPINFEQIKQTPPSQSLEPIKAYACGIMAWNSKRFKMNINQFGAAYHGGEGSIGFYELKGFSNVDIDNEEDFLLAEAVLNAQNSNTNKPRYYESEKEKIEDADREKILLADGVEKNFFDEQNKQIQHIEKIIEKRGTNASWSHTLINSPSNCATLIAQMPGEGNRMHYHHDWDEWWYIVKGQWEWTVEGVIKKVKEGDIVFIERNKKHKIKAIGSVMSIRLAVSREDVDHVYDIHDY